MTLMRCRQTLLSAVRSMPLRLLFLSKEISAGDFRPKNKKTRMKTTRRKMILRKPKMRVKPKKKKKNKLRWGSS